VKANAKLELRLFPVWVPTVSAPVASAGPALAQPQPGSVLWTFEAAVPIVHEKGSHIETFTRNA